MKRFFGKNDILLAAALLLICAASLLPLRAGDPGRTAEVSVDGRPFASYSLSNDRSVEIVTEYGSNILEIKGGAASVSEADCPGGDCTRFAPISREGQILICLPHRLVVRISGGEEYDSVAY